MHPSALATDPCARAELVIARAQAINDGDNWFKTVDAAHRELLADGTLPESSDEVDDATIKYALRATLPPELAIYV